MTPLLPKKQKSEQGIALKTKNRVLIKETLSKKTISRDRFDKHGRPRRVEGSLEGHVREPWGTWAGESKIRAEIFAALDDNTIPPPQLSNENLIINELIREYLMYNNYRQTLSVFLPETGQPEEAKAQLNRAFLAKELQVPENSSSERVPLLYGMLSKYQGAANVRANRIERKSPVDLGDSNGEMLGNFPSAAPSQHRGPSPVAEVSENSSVSQNIMGNGLQPTPLSSRIRSKRIDTGSPCGRCMEIKFPTNISKISLNTKYVPTNYIAEYYW